jgi:hypothetical protein
MTNKFHHLRTASIHDGSKKCPWPGCVKQIPLALHSCQQHWMVLPKPIRDAIWDAYEVGQEQDLGLVSREYQSADQAAKNWITSFLAANDG